METSGALKRIAATILLCSCFVRIHCDCDAASVSSSAELEQEIQRLRSKVASLEDEISGRREETSQLEGIVREKTAQIAALVGGLEVMQVINTVDDEYVMKASTDDAMLEKQIQRLGNDLEDQVKKGELLEARASKAEKSLLELGQKLQHVERTNVEQRQRIEELGHDLQHAKDKLSEVEREARLKAEELAKVHGMWLPYRFASSSVHCQELASAKWYLHGKPVLDALMQKVSEKLARAQRLVEPHLQATQNKLVPLAQVHFNSLKNSTKPYVSAVATRSTAAYRVCRDAIQPCMVKTQEFADQYWQVSKKLSKPYITQIAAASEPHLARASVVLEPYMRPVTSSWRQLVVSASIYHRRVQKGIGHFLEDNELLDPLSADRLAWLTASALSALPMFSIYKIISTTICKKIQTARDRGGSRSSNRKHKRRVEDKRSSVGRRTVFPGC